MENWQLMLCVCCGYFITDLDSELINSESNLTNLSKLYLNVVSKHTVPKVLTTLWDAVIILSQFFMNSKQVIL